MLPPHDSGHIQGCGFGAPSAERRLAGGQHSRPLRNSDQNVLAGAGQCQGSPTPAKPRFPEVMSFPAALLRRKVAYRSSNPDGRVDDCELGLGKLVCTFLCIFQ